MKKFPNCQIKITIICTSKDEEYLNLDIYLHYTSTYITSILYHIIIPHECTIKFQNKWLFD